MIVADWPDDLAYFCHLLVTGPGEMIAIGGLRLELINGSGFSAAANSKIPHNALHDARALKDFCLDSAYRPQRAHAVDDFAPALKECRLTGHKIGLLTAR